MGADPPASRSRRACGSTYRSCSTTHRRIPTCWPAWGINTATTPSGYALWSPRLGLNYDASGRGSTFSAAGSVCSPGGRPTSGFAKPTSTPGSSRLAWRARVTTHRLSLSTPRGSLRSAPGWKPGAGHCVLRPGLPLSTELKVTAGVDQRLPWDLVGTVDPLCQRGEPVCRAGRQPGAPRRRRRRRWPGALRNGRFNRTVCARAPQRRLWARDRDVQPLR